MVMRAAAQALIPEDAATEIIQGVTNKSAVMQMARIVRMKTAQRRLPMLSVLSDGAAYLDSDTALKPLTELEWSNKYLDAAPIATILVVPEDVLDDADFDIFAQARPQIEDDIARKIDNAIIFSINKPTVWPTAVVPAAIAAGNTVNLGAGADIFADINTAMMTVEADGYDVNGFWARQQFKGVLRNERDANRGFLYPPNGPANVGGANNTVGGSLFGEKLTFSRAGLSGFSTASGNAHVVAGDWSQLVFGIRKDLTWKKLDQASLYDPDGSLRIALAQQDSVAIRVVGRFAFQVPNPINRMQETEANRYPFAVVRQA